MCAIYVSQVVMNIKLQGNVVRGMNVSKGNLSEIMEGRRMGKRRCMRTSSPCIIQHSPSRCSKSELGHEMLDFRRWKGLGKGIGDHVICRAVNKPNRAIFDDVVDEMKANVNVLGASVVLVILHECDGGLVV